MLIKIDTRENDLHVECVKRLCGVENIQIDSEMLPIGDIIICSDQGEELVMIERKTLRDLASSIRDGRYKEQGFRLNDCSVHNHNIVYLVEGNLRSYNPVQCRLERQSLLSSFVTLTYFKGFSLHRTESLGESAEWIISYALKLQRENKKSFYHKDTDTTNGSYVSVSARVKKNNVTTDNIGAIMLSQIPGVSTAVAMAVMERYGTLKQLIDELHNDSSSLDDITIATKTNKPRKISKTSCQNIYDYLVAGEKSEINIATE
tara:strand:+ start:1223 stop:2005 length:783 start_codon:yes stop_codon:yes gene_type:complete